MTELIIALVFLGLVYLTFINIMDIQYKLHKKDDYSEKEYDADKTISGALVAVLFVVIFISITFWNQ